MNEHRATRAIRGTTPEIERRAREMRAHLTPEEDRLWQAIRGNQVDGLRFRAQHPVGRFILDFYCAALKLVIEIDGDSHNEQADRDSERSAILESYGYFVVRFGNAEVQSHLADVVDRIRIAASTRTQDSNAD